MGRMRSLVVVVVGGLWASPALAHRFDNPWLYECYFRRQALRYAEALELCRAAVDASRSGRTLGQLALTEIALERWGDAATHLTEALADREHLWVADHRATLEEAMARVRPHVGVLRIETDEALTSLAVNGHSLGALPPTGTLFLSSGEVLLAARWREGESVERAVTVLAGQTLQVSLSRPSSVTSHTAIANLATTNASSSVATALSTATLHAAPTARTTAPGTLRTTPPGTLRTTPPGTPRTTPPGTPRTTTSGRAQERVTRAVAPKRGAPATVPQWATQARLSEMLVRIEMFP